MCAQDWRLIAVARHKLLNSQRTLPRDLLHGQKVRSRLYRRWHSLESQSMWYKQASRWAEKSRERMDLSWPGRECIPSLQSVHVCSCSLPRAKLLGSPKKMSHCTLCFEHLQYRMGRDELRSSNNHVKPKYFLDALASLGATVSVNQWFSKSWFQLGAFGQ